MGDQIESTGKSVEEALRNALTALGAQPAEARWEVLDTGSSGFLGLVGARPARVRAERLVRRHSDVRDLVLDLMRTLDIDARVEATQSADAVDVAIETDGMDGLLIGKRGQTLVALQHVVGRLVSREFGFGGRVTVDVGGYRQRREAQLIDKARTLAEKVRITGREINLEPLHAPDRRIVHLALAGMPGIRTYTVGQGLHRNIVIAPNPRAAAARP